MNNLVQFLHVCVQNRKNFIIKNWEMVEKIKTDVDRLLLVSTMKKQCPIYFAETELFFNFETKNSLSTSVFIFTISQISKIKFYVLQTEACRNLKAIKFAYFLSITCP